MDEIIARIKEYVEAAYPSIMSDLDIDEGFLDFIVNDVIDRALIFMNRDQLVDQYEYDLGRYPDKTNTFWLGYEYPIPKRIERVLARTIVQSARTLLSQNKADSTAVASISDNGQSISYKDQLANFFSSSDDSDIFSGNIVLLRAYRLAGVGFNSLRREKFNNNENPY